MDSKISSTSVPEGSDENFADIIISLNKILDHPSFRSSPRLSAFLSYVVSEEMAGRGQFIKAYTVAVDALGRPESFDPSKDPVIRVLATRLRKALATYYEDSPKAIPVEIRLVRGSYRPKFTRRTHVAPIEKKLAPEEPATMPAANEKMLHRYFVAVVVLSALLAISMLYLVWDLVSHLSEQPGSPDTIIQHSVAPVAELRWEPRCADLRTTETGADCLYTVPDAFRLVSTGSISAAE